MITLLLIATAAAAAKPTATPSPIPTEITITRSQKGSPAGTTALEEGAPGKQRSLADAVRESQAREQPEQKKRSLGTITNDSLKGAPSGTPRATKGTMNTAPAPSTVTHSYSTSDPTDSKGRTEAHWREGAQKSRDRVANAEKEIQRLEKESRQLENDYYAWSDGTYRDNVIKPAWDQSRAALVSAREALERAKKTQEDVAEEARKSGVPPGWLRENGGSRAPEPTRTPSGSTNDD